MDRIKQFEPIFGELYVESFIGAGSFGRVYKIYRDELGNRFYSALKHISIPVEESELKQLRADGMDDTSISNYYNSLAKSISAETTLMNKLRGNTNIVGFEDSRVIPKQSGVGYDIFIRMELLESLTNRIAEAPLSEAEVVDLGSDICRALSICSKQGIIHRDIKPDNIFISKNGDYKLGDFGIARQLEKTATFMSKKGTYNYMAPEVYRGEQYGASCDIYSLGIVMYRLLNGGRLPLFPAAPQQILPDDRESALVRRMGGEAFPAPVNASPELSKIVLKACAFKPKNRYASADEMLQTLSEYRSVPNHKRVKDGNNTTVAANPPIRRAGENAAPPLDRNPMPAGPERAGKSRKGLIAGIAAALLTIGVVAALALSGVFGNANKVKGRGKQAMNSAEPTFSAAPGETEADLTDEPDGTADTDGQTNSPDPTRTDLPYPSASGEHTDAPTHTHADFTPAPTDTAISNITPAPTSRPTSIPTNAPTGTPPPVVSPTPRITAAPTVTPGLDPIVYFTDSTFERAFKWKYGLSGTIHESRLLAFSELKLDFCGLNNASDVARFKNLSVLYLNSNSISNIESLAGLTKLTLLKLYNNNISDITPLAGLTDITILLLNENNISDITSLGGMTKLTELYLHNNNISDITPLAELTNLRTLYLAGNPLTSAQIAWLMDKLPNCLINF